MNELSTYFGVSKSIEASRSSENSKNGKNIKYGKSFWCTINKCRGLKKTPTVKDSGNNWIINQPHIIILPITNDYVKINVTVKN